MQSVPEVFGVSAVGGLHVPAARLWLDGRQRAGLAFVSDVRARPVRMSRVLCSADLARIWGAGPSRPLAPPFCEAFKLGRLGVELLPAGGSPGSAMLAIEGGERDLLIADAARPDPLPPGPAMPSFDADVLVLDARLGAVEHATVGHLRFAVSEAVDQLHQGARGAVWLCDDPVVSLAIAHAVGDGAPIYANLAVKRLSWRYLAAGFAVPIIHRLGAKAPTGSFVIWPARRADDLADRDTDDFLWTLVAERADDAMADQVGAEHALPFARRAAGTELDRLALDTGARDVVALGAGAAALCSRLADRGVRGWILQADRQLRLWHSADGP